MKDSINLEWTYNSNGGRTSRLVMNLSLMNSGYLPVIVKKEERLEYYNALDKAHTTGDYTKFCKIS